MCELKLSLSLFLNRAAHEMWLGRTPDVISGKSMVVFICANAFLSADGAQEKNGSIFCFVFFMIIM